MTNRKLADIVKDQKPLVMPAGETVQNACRSMCERRIGSVLVVDDHQQLIGIFHRARCAKSSRERQWLQAGEPSTPR